MSEFINYKIRKALPEDVLTINQLLLDTWLLTYPNTEFNITVEDIKYRFEQRNQPDEVRRRQERIKSMPDNERLLVLEVDNKIVALCNTISLPEINSLQSIYVLPDYQGRGLAYALWQEASKIFDFNRDTIVEVAAYNHQAIIFYEKLGFKKYGSIIFNENLCMRNGAIIPEIQMMLKK